ncbi:hypothetical protein BDV93DRAFT_516171 [Ceratobasidium sp. AG-I]|nr:hypothetical protein BDV93DRAFT_516171 [Ceratobasidium sp. AG-I]
MTYKPKASESLDWVVAEGLGVPTHLPDLCKSCNAWSNHTHYSMHESCNCFKLAQIQANLDIRSDMTRKYKAQLKADCLTIQLAKARVCNEQLQASIVDKGSGIAGAYEERPAADNSLYNLISKKLADKTAETLWCQAKNKQLAKMLKVTVTDHDSLKEQLHHAIAKLQELQGKLPQAKLDLLGSNGENHRFLHTLHEPPEHRSRAGSTEKLSLQCSKLHNYLSLCSSHDLCSGGSRGRLLPATLKVVDVIELDSSSEDESGLGPSLAAISRPTTTWKTATFPLCATTIPPLFGDTPYAHKMTTQLTPERIALATKFSGTWQGEWYKDKRQRK